MSEPRLMRILASGLFVAFMSVPAQSFDGGFAHQDGGQPGAFLSYGAGARALGMGKTFVGIADDASAVYWNPAGLGQVRRREIVALYASLYEQTEYGFAGYAHPFSERYGTLGGAVVSLESKGFSLRDEYNTEVGEGCVSETAALISYGRTILGEQAAPSLMAGASIKGVRQMVDTRSATGLGMDAGLLYNAAIPLTIGLSIQNILPVRLTLDDAEDIYPLSITAGAGYRLFNRKLLVAVDVNKAEKREYKLRAGSEYVIARMLAVRAGVDETELSCGLGFSFRDYSIDYAFSFHDAWQGHEDLGASHRLGITIPL